jgi:hypothetical protein
MPLTSLLLPGAIVSLVAWGLLAFGTAPATGVVHVPLALGTTLLVAWWGLRS